MKRHCLAWSVLSATVSVSAMVCFSGYAQQSSITRMQLVAGEKVPVTGQFSTGRILAPIKCDAKGNIYIRPALGPTTTLSEPVLGISADGQKTTLYNLGAVSELKEAKKTTLWDYGISPRGQLYELLEIQYQKGTTSVGIAVFDADGRDASLIPIDVATVRSNLSPRQVTRFVSGEFLISGIAYSKESASQKSQQRPFTAIFGPSGKLSKEIGLSGDPDRLNMPEKPDYKNPSSIPFTAIDAGEVATGDDGNVYLLRNGDEPTVYVISPSGDVLRSFRITKPAGERISGWPTMRLALGRLAFDYYEKSSTPGDPRTHLIVSVVDAQTGDKLWEYRLADGVYGVPSCYNGNEFTLLTVTEDKHLALQRASAR